MKELTTQAELNIAIKKVQLERQETELRVHKGELCSRAAVQSLMVRNGALVKNIFMSLAGRIRQELGLTLDQRDSIDKVIDSVMLENLNGSALTSPEVLNGELDAAPVRPKRVRRLKAT
jgi:hypothetical protein